VSLDPNSDLQVVSEPLARVASRFRSIEQVFDEFLIDLLMCFSFLSKLVVLNF
jgi:hypothetical protein